MRKGVLSEGCLPRGRKGGKDARMTSGENREPHLS